MIDESLRWAGIDQATEVYIQLCCLLGHTHHLTLLNKLHIVSLPKQRLYLQMVDVGCGIGGSSRHIAKKFGCKAEGITLSPVQVQCMFCLMHNEQYTQAAICADYQSCQDLAALGLHTVAVFAVLTFVCPAFMRAGVNFIHICCLTLFGPAYMCCQNHTVRHAALSAGRQSQ